MKYKTISYVFNVKDIVNYLVQEMGYIKTNLRDIIIKDLRLFNTNDELKKSYRISNNTLYTPLVYRDNVSFQILLDSVRLLLDSYPPNSCIDCEALYRYTIFNTGSKLPSISCFRAEYVFIRRMNSILSQYKVIKNEKNFGYLP
jgi:hypothetical protein